MTRGFPVRLAGAALTVTVFMVAAGARVHTDDPVSSSVRFTGEIVRIFDRKCQPCHEAGGLAMPLSNYGDVRAWGRAIREEIVEQRMPPWNPARGFGRFRNDLSLSARETLTVLSWLDGGMPRGDDRDLPKPAAAGPARTADRRLALPAQRVPALEDHVVRRVTIQPNGLDPARAIGRVTIASSHRETLRGALIYAGADPATARWIGAWLPWQRETAAPAGHAIRLAAGTPLSVELHYRGGDVETVDEPAIEVSYADGAPKAVDEIAVTPGHPVALPRASTVWAIVPTGAADGSSMQLTARRPDGSREILLWVPHVSASWPAALVLDQPVALPAGTIVSLLAHPMADAVRVRLSVMR